MTLQLDDEDYELLGYGDTAGATEQVLYNAFLSRNGNTEVRKRNQKAWIAKNKAKVLEQQRARSKRYYEANRERILAADRAKRAAHKKPKIKRKVSRQLEWYRRNKAKVAEYQRLYRERKKTQKGKS